VESTTRDCILNWLKSTDEGIDCIHARLEHLAKIRLATPLASWTPRKEDLREFVEVAFWASLRSNEERPTRVRIALTPDRVVPVAFALASPVDYHEAQIAKLAHVVPSFGSLLVSPETGGLKIWGFSRTSPGSGIDGVVADVVAPGIVRINVHMFRPFAVLVGREAYIMGGCGRIDLARYLETGLRKRLPHDDIVAFHQGWHECMVLGVLATMIVDQGHGGMMLIVPDEEGEWLGSLDPFAFKFSIADKTAHEWIRQNLPFNQSRSETMTRVLSSNLRDDDKSYSFMTRARC
jgi:hypothetical protein